jgi:hypothetical protein
MSAPNVDTILQDVADAKEQYLNAQDKMVGHVVWTTQMVQTLTFAILGLTLCALVMSAILLWSKDRTGNDILRVFGIILIISLSAVLLVIGYSNEQLTPVVGLFGAIAGYLLGHQPKSQNPA